MFSRRTFIICAICIHLAQSASVPNRNMTEQCRRLSNELDDNNIVSRQTVCNSRAGLRDYLRDRADLLNYEVESSFGADIKLTDNEELANKIIIQAKEDEYKVGIVQPYLFNPSRHIFEVLDVIKQSKLFQIVQKMPKGGILHAHDTGLCSANYVVSLTYLPDLWQRTPNDSNEIEEFVFSREQPKTSNANNEVWHRVEEVRAKMGASKYDEFIRKTFTLYDKTINPRIQFADINEVWSRFQGLFIRVNPILTYVPVWKAYYKHALKEMLDDGVQYLEFRATLAPVLFFIAHTIC